jgi:phage/plasmid-associated DNA primase
MPELLLKGEGSNGKDSLRKILDLIFLSQLSSIDLNAIKRHDTDTQKFGLTGMNERTRINFSSENRSVDLSKMETNKKLVTGDPVVVAHKREDQKQICINALQIHCTNRPMHLSNPQMSIVSRIQMMSLPYSFVSPAMLAKKQGASDAAKYLLADPCFNDRHWLAANVVPAIFNMLLAHLEAVLNRGSIDWACCEHEREAMVGESNHLQGFLASEFVTVTDEETDYCASVRLYSLYQEYCVSIDRAVREGMDFREADPDAAEAKFDKLCLNLNAFSKRMTNLLGRKPIQKKVAGKNLRVFTGILG